MQQCSRNYAPESFLSGQLMLMLNSARFYIPAQAGPAGCKLLRVELLSPPFEDLYVCGRIISNARAPGATDHT